MGVGRRRAPHILFVEQFYYPDGWGGAELPLDVTVRLARAGNQVQVVCGSEPYAPVEGEPPQDPRLAGVAIRRVPALPHGGRMARQLWFCAVLAAALVRRPPDLYVAQTNPPPAIVLLALAAAFWRKPLLLIAMDVYPEVMFAHGMLRERGPAGALLRRVFAWAYRRAARVVSLGPGMSVRLRAKGVRAERIVEIPVWATGGLGASTSGADSLRARWGLEGRFVVLYSGNLGLAHEFDTLLEAVELASRSQPLLCLLIIGRGRRLAEVKTRVQELALRPFVRFEDPLPAAHLPDAFGLAQLAAVTLQPGFDGLVTPSKLQGYLARGLPVLYIGPDCDVDQLIALGGCGICKRGGDVRGTADALVKLAADPARLAELGRCAQALYASAFDRELGLARYEALVRELLPHAQAAAPAPPGPAGGAA